MPTKSNPLTDQQFIRYNRHVMADNIGELGQQSIIDTRVIIIGIGGLGCPVSQYLAASGVGHLSLIDHDNIEVSNLQRQVLYTTQDIGKPKVEVAKERLQNLNTLITIKAINQSVFDLNLAELFAHADVILDCTDNAETRHLINSEAVKSKVKLVSASAIQGQGQLVSFDFSNEQSPCYECLFPNKPTQNLNCSTSGVFSPLLGVMGSLQAAETLRLILKQNTNLNHLLTFDAWGMQMSKLKITQDQGCRCCSG